MKRIFKKLELISLHWQIGSESDHVPFELQVVELEPTSAKPGSQANVAVESAIGRPSTFVDVPLVTVPFAKVAIAKHVAKSAAIAI